MNLMELFIKLSVDDKDVGTKLDDNSEKVSNFGDKLKGGLATAAKVSAAALAAAGTAVVALGKQAISSYADYEQLVGGVETLFKNSSDIVQQYAANAYKTAGLSANEYMETVTSFSASLLQSLGGDTEAAAKVADLAITDMSDNANKMGSDMSLIQNAYQGFAKQNYTMLDNLKLGYGGTKTEMERLIEDANKLKEAQGEVGDLSIESYADIVEAIHMVQTEMDITGTTQKEAAETISGSLGMAKSAWQNLLTGISDDKADFGQLIDNLVSSVGAVGKNILPRITTTLKGVGKLVEQLAPVVVQAIGTVVPQVLPSLVASALTLLTTLGDALIANLPLLMDTAVQLITQLVGFISNNSEKLVAGAVKLIMVLANGLLTNIPKLIETAGQLVAGLIRGIISNLPQIVAIGFQLVLSLVNGVINNFQAVLKVGTDIVKNIVSGIRNALGTVFSIGVSIFNKVRDGIKSVLGEAKTWGKDLIENFKQGIKDKLNSLAETVSGVAGKIRSLLHFSEPDEGPLSDFHTYAPDMMELFAKGIRDNEKMLRNQVASSFDFGNVIATANVPQKSNGANASGVTIVQHIEAVAQTPAQFANATAAYFEQARWAMA